MSHLRNQTKSTPGNTRIGSQTTFISQVLTDFQYATVMHVQILTLFRRIARGLCWKQRRTLDLILRHEEVCHEIGDEQSPLFLATRSKSFFSPCFFRKVPFLSPSSKSAFCPSLTSTFGSLICITAPKSQLPEMEVFERDLKCIGRSLVRHALCRLVSETNLQTRNNQKRPSGRRTDRG